MKYRIENPISSIGQQANGCIHHLFDIAYVFHLAEMVLNYSQVASVPNPRALVHQFNEKDSTAIESLVSIILLYNFFQCFHMYAGIAIGRV